MNDFLGNVNPIFWGKLEMCPKSTDAHTLRFEQNAKLNVNEQADGLSETVWPIRTSDWITSKICEGIFCGILSETQHHHITSLFIGWHFVLCS